MEATRLSNTKGLRVPLDYASTILARVEAERDSLRAENARLREALKKVCDASIDAMQTQWDERRGASGSTWATPEEQVAYGEIAAAKKMFGVSLWSHMEELRAALVESA